jgi:hypothetical protein
VMLVPVEGVKQQQRHDEIRKTDRWIDEVKTCEIQ